MHYYFSGRRKIGYVWGVVLGFAITVAIIFATWAMPLRNKGFLDI